MHDFNAVFLSVFFQPPDFRATAAAVSPAAPATSATAWAPTRSSSAKQTRPAWSSKGCTRRGPVSQMRRSTHKVRARKKVVPNTKENENSLKLKQTAFCKLL